MKRYFVFLTIGLLCLASCGKTEADPDDPFAGDPLKPAANATVYGRVKTADGTGISGVLVSDGVIFAKTDGKGVYNMPSAKKNSLVFIINPSGYMVGRELSQPQFYQQLTKEADKAERHDFFLYSDPDQDNHTRYVFGDIHLYNDDAVTQFAVFKNKVNEELKKGVDKLIYGLTLGDMTWDLHWYDTGYTIPKYLAQMNKVDMPVFCTVGNHDHDMKDPSKKWFNSKAEVNETGEDWTVQIPYRAKQGPTCYSANIGKIHYISMDDAITIDDGTGLTSQDHRTCDFGFNRPDQEWLEKDLSYVPMSTPIVLSVHIPFTYREGGVRSPYGKLSYPWFKGRTLANMLEPFAGRKIIVLSAHTHNLYNNEEVKIQTAKGEVTFTEMNSGAVCGNFWGSAIKASCPLCSEGAPAGYRVLEFEGTALKSNVYQAYGKKGFYPFRSYDRNQINLESEKASPFSMTYPGFYTKSSENLVYIHVWDYMKGWSISVTENGTPLEVTDVKGACDPFYILMYDSGKAGSEPSKGSHLFCVKASAANTTLEISVSDPYGHTAKETMTRPKKFEWASYVKEDYSK